MGFWVLVGFILLVGAVLYGRAKFKQFTTQQSQGKVVDLTKRGKKPNAD